MRGFTLCSLSLLAGLTGCEPFPGTSSGSSGSSSTSSGDASAAGSSGTAMRGESLNAQKLCPRLVNECGQALTMADCLKSFGPLRVTATCNAAILSATCADLGSANGATLGACFPPCAGPVATCNIDGTLTHCTESGTTRVSDCQASCLAAGFAAWTRTCGNTFEGQTSAVAQCWCK